MLAFVVVDSSEQEPVPIRVLIIRSEEILRIRHPNVSVRYRLPAVSPAIA